MAIDPVVDENNKVTHFLGIIRDINSVVEARNKLKVAMESAKAATIAKNEFLASMSHEIRTPMNGVIGMLGLLLKSPMNVEQESRVKIAESSAKSLLVLINDILDFSKIEAKKIELESLDFNLIETVGEVAKGIAIQAHDKGLELVLCIIKSHEFWTTHQSNELIFSGRAKTGNQISRFPVCSDTIHNDFRFGYTAT